MDIFATFFGLLLSVLIFCAGLFVMVRRTDGWFYCLPIYAVSVAVFYFTWSPLLDAPRY